MSEAVDTSAEAVERSVEELLGWITGPDSGHNDGVVEAVQLIRALSTANAQLERERGASRRDVAQLEAFIGRREDDVLSIARERDAAIRERDAAREALRRFAKISLTNPSDWVPQSEGKHLQAAIAACPGLLAPPPPRTTDATATISEGWWA